MQKHLSTSILSLTLAAAFCGCDAIKAGDYLGAQWISSAHAAIDVDGTDLDSGRGLEVVYTDAGSLTATGVEFAFGAARYSLNGTDEDVGQYWLRLGGRGVLKGSGPLFAYGAAGCAIDVVDSESLHTFVTYPVPVPAPIPLGVYARAWVGVRHGRGVFTIEGWATASLGLDEDEDMPDWFAASGVSIGIGAVW